MFVLFHTLKWIDRSIMGTFSISVLKWMKTIGMYLLEIELKHCLGKKVLLM
jgi:hypothetical protein